MEENNSLNHKKNPKIKCFRCHSLFSSAKERQFHISKCRLYSQKLAANYNDKTLSAKILPQNQMEQINSHRELKAHRNSYFSLLQEHSKTLNSTILTNECDQMKKVPLSEYKCCICDIVVTPGTLKTFNMHLKSCHFNQELLEEFLIKQPPYVCIHNSCIDYFSKTGSKGKQFNSPIDLLDHMIDSHNLVLDMYHDRVGQKLSSSAINAKNPSKENLAQGSSATSENIAYPKKSVENVLGENKSVFVCIVCKNRNASNHNYDFISEYKKYKSLSEESMPAYNFSVPPGVFFEETLLRNHLVDAHFSDLIVKFVEREIKVFLDKNPVVCPVFHVSRSKIRV